MDLHAAPALCLPRYAVQLVIEMPGYETITVPFEKECQEPEFVQFTDAPGGLLGAVSTGGSKSRTALGKKVRARDLEFFLLPFAGRVVFSWGEARKKGTSTP